MSAGKPVQSSGTIPCCCCIPECTPCTVAVATFAIGAIFALAMYVTHTLPQYPHLQNTYYSVFGAALAMTGIAFIVSTVVAVRNSCRHHQALPQVNTNGAAAV